MVKVKMTGAAYEAIKADIQKHSPKETMMFAQAKRVQHDDDEIYLVPSFILLDEDEAVRTTGAVWPSDSFQLWLYRSFKKEGLEKGFRVVTIHSHPFQGRAQFSCIDKATMATDREIYRQAYNGCEFVWMVFSKDAKSFEGCVVKQDGYECVNQLIVYGTELKVLHGSGVKVVPNPSRELYSRMLLIPEWDQRRIGPVKVAIIGLGGLGSSVLEAIIMSSIGDDAELVLVEHDLTEESNLSRIAYAPHWSVGKSKATIAKRYVKRARRFRRVTVIEEPCYSIKSQEAITSCDIILGCVDNELARTCYNYLSSSFMIPLLDLAAGVIIDEFAGQRVTISSGQARLFIPGTTPCLLCIMGIDLENFDRELLKLSINDDEKELLGKTGYLQNFLGTDIPEPSVYLLNAAVANIGVAFLIRYLLGGKVNYHTLHYTMESMAIEKLQAESQQVCPVCGIESNIGSGEFFDIDSLVRDKNLPVPKRGKNESARTAGAAN